MCSRSARVRIDIRPSSCSSARIRRSVASRAVATCLDLPRSARSGLDVRLPMSPFGAPSSRIRPREWNANGNSTTIDPMTRDPDLLLPSAEPVHADRPARAADRRRGRGVRDARPDDALVRAYRRLVIGRRLNDQATALTAGPARRLPLLARPGGLPGRGRAGARRRSDWLFPTYRDTLAAGRPRHRPGRGADPAARRLALRLRPDRAPRTAPQCTPLATQLLHAVGLAHAEPRKGADTVALAFVGDGAHQRGRLPRGAQLRRRVQGAGRLLRPEQRVRDQRPAGPADRRAVAGVQGRRLRHAAASRSTATTRSPCSRC